MNYYIGNIPVNADYLEHHGILGMKWGQRNGPPYPLDAQDHSAAEKKAGWRKSLGRDESKIERYERKKNKNLIRKNKDLESNRNARAKVEEYKLKRQDSRINAYIKDRESFEPLIGKGTTYVTRKGETRYALTPEDIDDYIATYDRLIKAAKEKREYTKFDFETGTKYIQNGISRYYDARDKYFDAKISAIKNPENKKSAEYKRAVAGYVDVILGDVFYGKSGTQMLYAGEESRQNFARDLEEYVKNKK